MSSVKALDRKDKPSPFTVLLPMLATLVVVLKVVPALVRLAIGAIVVTFSAWT